MNNNDDENYIAPDATAGIPPFADKPEAGPLPNSPEPPFDPLVPDMYELMVLKFWEVLCQKHRTMGNFDNLEGAKHQMSMYSNQREDLEKRCPPGFRLPIEPDAHEIETRRRLDAEWEKQFQTPNRRVREVLLADERRLRRYRVKRLAMREGLPQSYHNPVRPDKYEWWMRKQIEDERRKLEDKCPWPGGDRSIDLERAEFDLHIRRQRLTAERDGRPDTLDEGAVDELWDEWLENL